MATRIVYGLTKSENGWPMVDNGSCTWVKIPGAPVTLEIQNGTPLWVMRAFAADFHAYIEPLRDADSACFTWTNSVPSSNHLSGTAMDLNWNTHRFQIDRDGFDDEKYARLRALLDWYEGFIFWGNDWQSPKDAMHFQMGYGTYGNKRVEDFIARKIRPDGFSRYQRGDDEVLPTAVSVLARATGLSEDRAAFILPQVREGLIASECASNIRRIAMWLAQVGHESDSFNATEEYNKNGRYKPYIGRTWIQITWDYNYREFGKWCAERDWVPYPNYFVDFPRELAKQQWAGLGPAWYWTVSRPDINRLSDAGDLSTVTYRINGGYNGLPDRRARYERALALGNDLLVLTNTTPAQPVDEWEALMATEVESLSIYATPGEPLIPLSRMLQAVDAHGPHEPYVENLARKGDVDSLSRVVRTSLGQGKYGTLASAVKQATDVLVEIQTQTPEVWAAYKAKIGA